MEKIRSSPLSFLFPWLSPLVIKFVVVNGGIEVQLYRNNRLLQDWHASKLYHLLPEPLTKWIDDHHIPLGPQPYPLIKQLWQYLIPLASKKLIIDSSALAELEEVSQPQDLVLVWTVNHALAYIEGHYVGADRYPSTATDSQLKNMIVPIQQADFLLNSIIPDLQHYLPTCADFQFITNFAAQVIVSDARNRRLILTLQSNYPQFLPTIPVPQQNIDVLLAKQAIIQFPRQALTPVMSQLLQSGSSITIQGVSVPFFIIEQLPIMRSCRQISDDMVARITRSNPIVSIAMLKPTLSCIHTYENGVGKYTITATYQFQDHTLDMDALLAARQPNQHFVQQNGIWFEWPYNSNDLFNAIQQQRAPQVLLPEEVMGFDTRRIALIHKQPTDHIIQSDGMTPIERVGSFFNQLRYHGIPGGILGEPTGTLTVFLNACENLLHDNRHARILWLVSSNKKGSVTRAVNGTTINSYVTVASLVTLRDEPALISRTWTLVIYQGLDLLLDRSDQSRMLFQLKWKWALTSVTSKRGLSPLIMRVLHLPEQYYEQFWTGYLFDPLKSNNNVVTSVSGPKTEKTAYSVNLSPRAPAIQTPRVTVQLNPQTKQKSEQPFVQPDTNISAKSALSPIRRTIKLDQNTIVQLHQESEQLQKRLTVEDEEEQKQLHIISMPDPVSAASVVKEVAEAVPEVDEDWQIILQQWQPEHWEIITLIYQEQYAQLTIVEQKVHRPVSRLIDEINSPVDEQLGDLLVDPDSQIISHHLRTVTKSLVHWYISSKGR